MCVAIFSSTMHKAWRVIEELVDKGLVRDISVSNFPISLLYELLTKSCIKPSVNQVELCLCLQK